MIGTIILIGAAICLIAIFCLSARITQGERFSEFDSEKYRREFKNLFP